MPTELDLEWISCDFCAYNKAAQTAHLEAFIVKVRFAISALVALGLVLGTSGCNLIQPQATTRHYDAADGISFNVGDLQLRNLTLISNDGESGSLLMSAINTTGSDISLNVQFLSKGAMVNGTLLVPSSHTATSWGAATESKIILDGINTPAGSLLKMYFQYGSVDGATTLVPVLTSAQPQYAGLEPSTTVHLGSK